jgi:hypothetical protein
VAQGPPSLVESVGTYSKTETLSPEEGSLGG